MSLLRDNHVYSYSQLSTFDTCPYSFYVQKIEHEKDLAGNAFASLGTLIHELIDLWAKGEISAEDLPHEYEKRYKDAVPEAWPRMLAAKGYAEKAYAQGLEYFSDFDRFEGYKIVETESKYTTSLCGRPFIGIIDMILEDEKDGKLIVLDHKSKSLKEFKKNENEMYRQQLLYSQFVYEKYDRWPDTLGFNLFKEHGQKFFRPFDKKDFDDACTWANDIMTKIESFDMFDFFTMKENKSNRPDFFCTEICSCRKVCPNGHLR